MTDGATRVREYVEHIHGAIVRIETYITGLDQAQFQRNQQIQDAVIRNVEIIGEAARRIMTADSTFAEQHPQFRLDLAYRMRNALVHGYDAVNLAVVWNTIQRDMPRLKRLIGDLSEP